MTTLLAVNPHSRQGDALPPAALEQLNALGPLDTWRFGADGSLRAAVARRLGDLERVVVAGGDGSLHLALPAVLEAGVPLGVLPLGTANDFARSLGLPEDPVEAAALIRRGHTRTVDIGTANGRPFLNAVGIGLGPELNRALDSESKRRFGVLAYLRGFLDVFRRRSRQGAVIAVDGRRRTTRYLQITIANGVHYGGGMTIARRARLDDGLLDVLCLQPQTAWRLLGKAIALRRGPAPETAHGQGMKLYSARRVEVFTRRPAEVTADGECVTTTPLTCRAIPQALDVYADAPVDRADRDRL